MTAAIERLDFKEPIALIEALQPTNDRWASDAMGWVFRGHWDTGIASGGYCQASTDVHTFSGT